MKQNRKGKNTFQGMYPLVKFDLFADSCEASESHLSSDRMTSEDDIISEVDVILVSDHEDDVVRPIEIVDEEHELHSVQVESDYNEGATEDTTENEVDVGDSFTDLDHIGFENDDISLNFGGNENFLSKEDLDTFFDNIHDVAHPATEI